MENGPFANDVYLLEPILFYSYVKLSEAPLANILRPTEAISWYLGFQRWALKINLGKKMERLNAFMV